MVKKLKGFMLLAILGLFATAALASEIAPVAGDCPGSGQNCKQTTDGSIYFKGLDQ